MQKFAEHWQRFFFEKIPPHGLACIRIALGFTLLALWGRYAADVSLMFSDAGVVVPYWETPLLTPPSVAAAWLLYGLLLLGILCILLGFSYRIACATTVTIIIYFGLLSFHNFLASWGRLLFFTLIILSMSNADCTLSLRMRRAQGAWTAWQAVPAWPQRMIAIQVAATYMGVGMQKAFLPDWQGGEIIAYSFVNMWSTPVAYVVARGGIPLCVYDALSWGVKLLHGLLPIGLWMKRYQRYCFAAGAIFHLIITITMGMWWFLLLIPLYLAFVDPRYLNDAVESRLHLQRRTS